MTSQQLDVPELEEILKVYAHLQSVMLKSTDQARNLGVVMDSDLSFNSHINTITKTAYYHLKNIARIKGLMSQQDLKKLFHAFIFSQRTTVTVSAPNICNKLPENCRTTLTLSSFESKLKTFFLYNQIIILNSSITSALVFYTLLYLLLYLLFSNLS